MLNLSRHPYHVIIDGASAHFSNLLAAFDHAKIVAGRHGAWRIECGGMTYTPETPGLEGILAKAKEAGKRPNRTEEGEWVA